MVIYKTTNLINGKIYVGKDKHNNPNYYGSGKRLNDAIKCYGKENFKKEIIEYCISYEQMAEREKYWIKELDSMHVNGKGYNLTEGGEGGDTFSNRSATEQEITRKKISKQSKKWNAINKDLHRKNTTKLWQDENYAQKVRDGVNASNTRPEVIAKRKRAMKKACNTPEQRAIRSKNASGTNNSNYKGPYYVIRGTILEEFTFKKEMTSEEKKLCINNK